MNWVDLTMLGIALFSALLSLWRGTLREILSVLVWGLAMGGAFLLITPIMQPLEPYIDVLSVRVILGYGGGLLLILIAGGLVNIILLQILKPRRPSTLNRLFSTLLGFTRGGFAVLALVFLASLTGLPNEPWWQASPLLRQLAPATAWLQEFVPVALASPESEELATASPDTPAS